MQYFLVLITILIFTYLSQLELSKYAKGVNWIKELLYQTEFTAERLKVTGAKIINDVAQVKRRGNKVVGDLLKGLLYKKGNF